MSKRFVKPDKIVVGRTYHLNQINKHLPYTLTKIVDDSHVEVQKWSDGKKQEKPRVVHVRKLLSTVRHDKRLKIIL